MPEKRDDIVCDNSRVDRNGIINVYLLEDFYYIKFGQFRHIGANYWNLIYPISKCQKEKLSRVHVDVIKHGDRSLNLAWN